MIEMVTQELLMQEPKEWVLVEKTGIEVGTLWENPETGASIALLRVSKGGGVPIEHRHASNQFMYCISGKYAYTKHNLVLEPGSFYMNPKGHPHGPTLAMEDCMLLEIYDGPHYFEVPEFHTEETVGKVQAE